MPAKITEVIAWLTDYQNAAVDFVDAVDKVLLELRNGGPSKLDLDELEIAHRKFNAFLRRD